MVREGSLMGLLTTLKMLTESICLNTRAGFPATIVRGGTS